MRLLYTTALYNDYVAGTAPQLGTGTAPGLSAAA
jgi:hypothetical protein